MQHNKTVRHSTEKRTVVVRLHVAVQAKFIRIIRTRKIMLYSTDTRCKIIQRKHYHSDSMSCADLPGFWAGNFTQLVQLTGVVYVASGSPLGRSGAGLMGSPVVDGPAGCLSAVLTNVAQGVSICDRRRLSVSGGRRVRVGGARETQ